VNHISKGFLVLRSVGENIRLTQDEEGIKSEINALPEHCPIFT